MSEVAENRHGRGKMLSWVKASITGTLGLLSGAIIMYASPWVERVVKPPRPVPNFGVQIDGLKATFVNQAEGVEGWWDFGDGSPLQPFAPEQKTLTHQYPRPGGYTARLLLRNLIGEENQREVNLHIDGTEARPPAIDLFDIQPLDKDRYAPATFRVKTKIQGAELCIWATGSDHPLEVVSDPPEVQERFITFSKPGQYSIKLAAVHGKKIVERHQDVEVQPAPFLSALAVVRVENQVTSIKTTSREHNAKVTFPDKVKGAVHTFHQDIPADGGLQIVAARFAQDIPQYIQNAKLEVTGDGAKVVLSGDYLPSKDRLKQKVAVPHWVAPLVLTQQSKSKPLAKAADPIVVRLNVPGTTTVPLPRVPDEWELQQRQLKLELYDGAQVVWKDVGLPKNVSLNLYNQPCFVTATEVDDQLKIDVQPDKKASPFWSK